MDIVTIHGQSDDLIEVEGAVREEFCTDARYDESILTFANGVEVLAKYNDKGCWDITVLSKPNNVVTSKIRHDNDVTRYSDVLTLVGRNFGRVTQRPK